GGGGEGGEGEREEEEEDEREEEERRREKTGGGRGGGSEGEEEKEERRKKKRRGGGEEEEEREEEERGRGGGKEGRRKRKRRENRGGEEGEEEEKDRRRREGRKRGEEEKRRGRRSRRRGEEFYLNKSPSAPDDVYIDSFLKDWKNDYKRLERVHSYIQWYPFIACIAITYLFNEQFLREDAKKRLVESYELMLGFYGIRLVDKDTGEVKRAENWKERFGNLENMHNNLRITRILKSLGELGFEHYQAPLVHFFLEETLVRKTLSSVKRSVLDYFLFAVLDKQKRQELVRYAYLHFEPKDKFVWCPRKIQRQFRKAEKRSEVVGNGDGKDDSRAKAKEMDTKEDAVDNKIKSPKAEKKSNDKIKPEASPEPKEEVVENGNACSETNNNINTCWEKTPRNLDCEATYLVSRQIKPRQSNSNEEVC
uniref:Opioid growth factor receptor (OGFr) conserved domain-containing protein n=1 Tax=Periophthalmus magnuspinnatus TaxID=409849 RepID=A0A3B3ZJ92_9GOBI